MNREELMLLRDPSRYEGNQAWRVHPARKSAGWFIRGTSSASVSLEKQLFPFKLRRIASTLGCVSRGRLPLLWTRSTVVYSILVALPQKRRSTLRADRLESWFRNDVSNEIDLCLTKLVRINVQDVRIYIRFIAEFWLYARGMCSFWEKIFIRCIFLVEKMILWTACSLETVLFSVSKGNKRRYFNNDGKINTETATEL